MNLRVNLTFCLKYQPWGGWSIGSIQQVLNHCAFSCVLCFSYSISCKARSFPHIVSHVSISFFLSPTSTKLVDNLIIFVLYYYSCHHHHHHPLRFPLYQSTKEPCEMEIITPILLRIKFKEIYPAPLRSTALIWE